mmetsp:Transcript_48266/g.114801  ORF Transcript_48266/g.114801 Transcript_48266/m.114801 type:complete len:197 (-) Transcript_48266:518-1108(-)
MFCQGWLEPLIDQNVLIKSPRRAAPAAFACQPVVDPSRGARPLLVATPRAPMMSPYLVLSLVKASTLESMRRGTRWTKLTVLQASLPAAQRHGGLRRGCSFQQHMQHDPPHSCQSSLSQTESAASPSLSNSLLSKRRCLPKALQCDQEQGLGVVLALDALQADDQERSLLISTCPINVSQDWIFALPHKPLSKSHA